MKLAGFSAALVLAGSAAATPLAFAPRSYNVAPIPTAIPSDVDPTVTPTAAPSPPSCGIPSVPSVPSEVKPTGVPQVCSCPVDDIPAGTPVELPDVDGLDSNLFAHLLSALISIINGLGFGGFAPGLLGLLNIDIVINNLEIVDIDVVLGGLPLPEINGLSPSQVTKVVTGLFTITKVLRLDQITSSGVLPQVDGISPDLLQAILNFVTGLVSKLGLQSIFTFLHIPAATDAPDLLVVGIFHELAPLVASLLTVLGLSDLAPLLSSLLNSLSIAL